MMRGRQIGSWISQREAAEPAPQKPWSVEPPPRRNPWKIGGLILLLALIGAVGWWLHREGGYRRFVNSLREGTVRYVEFQPYPNSAFVRVDTERGIRGVADWLGDARPIEQQYGVLAAADCQMRIVMRNGSIKRLWIGQTGPMRSGGTLVQSNIYIRLKGDDWQRLGFSSGLSTVYMQLPVSAQLPFSSIPIMPAPVSGGGTATTAPTGFGEVDASEAQIFLERGQLGQARRVLLRAMGVSANNGLAQQLTLDVQARIRTRLPLLVRELQNQLPPNAAKLDREQYLQLREKLLEATLMAPTGDPDLAELGQRLNNRRPEARMDQFKEILRLGGASSERYAIRDFAWSPDGGTIATCGDDGRVRVWDTINGDLLESFPTALGLKIYFSNDGQKVWVWNDQVRTWWDITTGNAAQGGTVADDAIKHAYIAAADGPDAIWIWMNGTIVKELAGHAGEIKMVKTSPDGDQVASFGEDKVLSIWGDGSTRLGDLPAYERMVQLKELQGPGIFLQDGSVLTFKNINNRSVRSGRKDLKILDIEAPSTVKRVEFSAGGDRMLVEMQEKNFIVVEADGKKSYSIKPIEQSCGRAGISPDGKMIAIGNLDGSVRLVTTDSGEELARLLCPPTRNRDWAAVEFSADGGWVMACGVGFVSLWNTNSREQVFYSEKAAVDGVAATFTPDGKALAIIYRDGGLRILRSNLRESEALGHDQSAIREPTFSKDGRWIAAIDKVGDVEIFDSSGNSVAHIAVTASSKSPDPLKFNDDGSALLMKAADGSVRLVDVPTGRELRRLTIKDVPNWLDMPCSFSLDGKYLIAGPMVWGLQ